MMYFLKPVKNNSFFNHLNDLNDFIDSISNSEFEKASSIVKKIDCQDINNIIFITKSIDKFIGSPAKHQFKLQHYSEFSSFLSNRNDASKLPNKSEAQFIKDMLKYIKFIDMLDKQGFDFKQNLKIPDPNLYDLTMACLRGNSYLFLGLPRELHNKSFRKETTTNGIETLVQIFNAKPQLQYQELYQYFYNFAEKYNQDLMAAFFNTFDDAISTCIKKATIEELDYLFKKIDLQDLNIGKFFTVYEILGKHYFIKLMKVRCKIEEQTRSIDRICAVSTLLQKYNFNFKIKYPVEMPVDDEYGDLVMQSNSYISYIKQIEDMISSKNIDGTLKVKLNTTLAQLELYYIDKLAKKVQVGHHDMKFIF